MSKLYHANGFFKAKRVIDSPAPFTLVVGGRGTGKTYGVLEELYIRRALYIYLRRTQAQIDIAMSQEFNPWKPIPNVADETIIAPVNKFCNGLFALDEEGNPNGAPLTIGAALSTFSNMRGFDASDRDFIVYDEFIPEQHEKAIKHEGAALLNAYETVNRNRELTGRKPVKFIGLANSNILENAIFRELNLINSVLDMEKHGVVAMYLKDRGIEIINLHNSPISLAKQDTVLYRATQGSDFAKMAIDNSFSVSHVPVLSRSLVGMRAVWCINYIGAPSSDCITIYRSNSENRNWYVTTHFSGNPLCFGRDEESRARFRRAAAILQVLSIRNSIDYEEYSCYTILKEYYNKR